MELRENGKNGDGVGGGQDGAENHAVDEADAYAFWVEKGIYVCQDAIGNVGDKDR